MNPLSILKATEEGDLRMNQAVLEGQNGRALHENNAMTLHRAAKKGRKDIVESLLTEGAEVNARDDDAGA